MWQRTVALFLFVLLSTGAATAEKLTERKDWAQLFSQADVTGTIIVHDERWGAFRGYVHNEIRALKRFTPASTFKIPHAVFALDAGVVSDEFQRFPWDGKKRWLAAWNQDQDLRSSMRHSVLWLYQHFARTIGIEKERSYVAKTEYGNQTIGNDVDKFWTDGSLRISALEQINLLSKLYRNQLPFDLEHQRLVKDVMINEAGSDWILRAKTGWGVRDAGNIGWWVGWVETSEGPVFFAMNIEMPGGHKDLSKRKSLTRSVLRSLDVMMGAK